MSLPHIPKRIYSHEIMLFRVVSFRHQGWLCQCQPYKAPESHVVETE